MTHPSKLNPTAAIIVIGDEILSGRTKDKNVGWLAKRLEAMGIKLLEARIIPDIKQVIIDTVLELSAQCDLVFTSGGIGPTHDDITTDAIAAAFGKQIIRNSEAEEVLQKHYQNTDLEFNAARQKMADIPMGATLIDNPLSAAPGFILENVHGLPGVPSILQAMFEGLSARLPGGGVMTRITVNAPWVRVALPLSSQMFRRFMMAFPSEATLGSNRVTLARRSSLVGLTRLSPERRRRRSPQRWRHSVLRRLLLLLAVPPSPRGRAFQLDVVLRLALIHVGCA